MARFIFDCEDEICLPAAYRLVDEIKPFVDKVKNIDVNENEVKGDRKAVLKKILENIMVKYPADTGKLLAKLWVLDEGEKSPNTFKTMATLFSNEVAIDFLHQFCPPFFSCQKRSCLC